jgi:hypothetical protein
MGSNAKSKASGSKRKTDEWTRRPLDAEPILGVDLMNWIRRYFKVSRSRQSAVLYFFCLLGVFACTLNLLYSPSLIAKFIFERAPVDVPHTEDRIDLARAQNASRPSRSTDALPNGPITGKNYISGLSRLDTWTAVYDISAHTVYLPNGASLEAHSGRGSKLDNPRFVHERMQGATPPHIYELALRERPFHGVRALRLKPIGGDEFIFGRTGLLAHTYMLGPKGDSNGCVVFKNYKAFLQAFENGEVKRLAVVAYID